MAGFIPATTDWSGIAMNAYKQGVGIGADSYQNAQAQRIQQAIIGAQMQQKDAQFQAELARKKTVDDAMGTYRAGQAADQKQRTGIMQQNADTNAQRASDTATLGQNKLDQQTATKAQQADWVSKNRPQDLDYFNAFGKLPGHDAAGFQTDPQTHAMEQLRKDVENNWAKAAKALKDASVDPKDTIGLDASDSVPGARRGREEAYKAAMTKIAALQLAHDNITKQLMSRHAAVAGLNPDNNMSLADTPGGTPTQPLPTGPAPAPAAANGPAVNIPTAPGFQNRSANPHVQPGGAAPAPGAKNDGSAPAPAVAPPAGAGMAMPAQAAPAISPEVKMQALQAVANERGVKVDAIQSLPPMTKLGASTLMGNLRKQTSDPNKLIAEFIRQAVMAGFDPTKPPADDAGMAPLPMK